MSTKRSLVWPIVVLACVLATVSVARGTYTGSLVWDADNTELVATDGWAVEGTAISYEVSGGGMDWHYKYILSFGEEAVGAPSHIIIETTRNLFTINSLDCVVYTYNLNIPWGGTPVWEVKEYVSSGNDKPNPYMPGTVWGVKFEGLPEVEDLDNVTIEFNSQHMPVWTDVFCVDGYHEGEYAAFWNAGFGTPNPTDPPWASVEDHILAPNGIIPEPLTMLGMLMGLGGVGAYIRKRRMA